MRSPATPAISYIRQLFAPEDALLVRIRERLEAMGCAIQVGADEGRFLQVLIAAAGVKNIVEIGTLGGYSTLWMARAIPDDGHIHTLEKSPENAAMARGHFAESEVGSKITVHEGDAVASLDSLDGLFDMVFIDADKASYCKYLDWAEKHIRPGGLIVGDNTFLFGGVYQDPLPKGVKPSTAHIMQEFNRRLADQNRYTSIVVPTEEGMTVAVVK